MNEAGFQLDTTLMVVAAVATGVVVLLGVARLSRFYLHFIEAKKDVEANLLTLNGQVKAMQASLTELVSENRRQSRLLLEQLNLKRAEMTGDYEIVEEPIPEPQPAAAPAPEPQLPPAPSKPVFNFAEAFKKNKK